MDDVHPVRERFVNRAALRHLRKPCPLGVVERPTDRHLRLDPVDPSVGTFVAVYAVVGVHPVEVEPHANFS